MLLLHVVKYLTERGRGAARPSPAAEVGQAIDFGRIGDLGERPAAPCAGNRDQQQLVAAAEQVDLLVVGQRGPDRAFRMPRPVKWLLPRATPGAEATRLAGRFPAPGQTAADGRQRRVPPAQLVRFRVIPVPDA